MRKNVKRIDRTDEARALEAGVIAWAVAAQQSLAKTTARLGRIAGEHHAGADQETVELVNEEIRRCAQELNLGVEQLRRRAAYLLGSGPGAQDEHRRADVIAAVLEIERVE